MRVPPPKPPPPLLPSSSAFAQTDAPPTDTNVDRCIACGFGGEMICCEECPASLHFSCCRIPLDPAALPDGDWFCAVCECERNRAAIATQGTEVSQARCTGLPLAAALAEDMGFAPEAEFWIPPTWILEVGEAIGGPPVNPLAAFGYDVVPNSTGTGLQFAPYRNPANAVLVGPSGTLALRTCSVCDGAIQSDLRPRVNALADIFGADRDFLDSQSYPRAAPDRLHCVKCGVVQHPWCTPNPHAAFAVAQSAGARDQWQCADCAPSDDVDAATLLTTVRIERDTNDVPSATFAETDVVRQELATIDAARARTAAEAAPASASADQDKAMLVLIQEMRKKHPGLATPSNATLASLATLSPAFVQFLAWQRLMQLNAKAEELQSALHILEEGERELNANALVKASSAAAATRAMQGAQMLSLLDTNVVDKFAEYNAREVDRRKSSNKVRQMLGLPPLADVATKGDTTGITALAAASSVATNSRRGDNSSSNSNKSSSSSSSNGGHGGGSGGSSGGSGISMLGGSTSGPASTATVQPLSPAVRFPSPVAVPGAIEETILHAKDRVDETPWLARLLVSHAEALANDAGREDDVARLQAMRTALAEEERRRFGSAAD
mmetsp:Transcript_11346/g.36041  ORF Transcript_11346/g.36041 Transcript_11346/m.36041 type:complete len:612 (-) Transcript_11346:2668-4503(-)